VIELSLGGVDAAAQWCWLVLARQLLTYCPDGTRLLLEKGGLDEGLQHWLDNQDYNGCVEIDQGPFVVSTQDAFAFTSAAGSLTPGLVQRIGRVVVKPGCRPESLGGLLFWNNQLANDIGTAPTEPTAQALGNHDLARAKACLSSLRSTDYQVSLISSVFDADRFLEHFLVNMAAIEGYDQCQHFLIRAGSPGDEHEALMAHAARHPGAVYVNLPQDPGLYETWNMAVTLAAGQYLSNANVDDRRHPEQVRRLGELLAQNPDADVASGALRVTSTANQDWEGSDSCPVWYDDRDELDYPVSRLIERHRGGKLVARNRPHCMPLWRRSLHLLHGFFDEQQYGPSADWEMWLRCGAGGSRFCRTAQPLGLYLKHAESYWRRDSSARRFDERIKLRYADLNDQRAVGAGPRSLPWRDLERFRQSGHWLGVLACLKRLHDLPAKVQRDPDQTRSLVEKLAGRWLGVSGLGRGLGLQGSGPAVVGMRRLTVLAVLLAGDFFASEKLDQHLVRRWQMVLSDLFKITGDVTSLVALARLAGVADCCPETERELLARAVELDARGFWHGVQQVYRFSRSLPEWLARVGGIRMVGAEGDVETGQPVRVVYFPSYSNKYQDLLYWRPQQSGADVRGLERLAELSQVRPGGDGLDILHLHWLNAVFEQSDEEFDDAAAEFLEEISRLKKSGFRIYWTVHNRLIHDSPRPQAEQRFRKQLARLVDRVYLHHPLLRYELDWLPADVEPWLCEHGPYVEPVRGGIDRFVARQRLDMDTEARAFLWFGQMRPYKALEEYLPAMLQALDNSPSAWLTVAGKVRAPEIRKMLESCGHRTRFINRHVPNIELQHLANAADFGVLTYRHILTSGAMFHMYCMGLPVVAPDMGAMAGYVVSGWNGFLYRGADELREIMERVCTMEDDEIEWFSANARETAANFSWGRIV
jgi:glycosyltransferase involved in cell wall biosynthesis